MNQTPMVFEYHNEKFYYLDSIPEGACHGILFMTHGFPSNAYEWDNMAQYFQDNYRIIRPFFPGAFQNDSGNKTLNLAHLSKAYIKLIESLSEKSQVLYLIGHDLGCFVNYEIALNLTSRCEGIININGLSLEQYNSRLIKLNLGQFFRSSYVFLAQFSIVHHFLINKIPNCFLRTIYKLSKVPKESSIYKNQKFVIRPISIYKDLLKQCFKRIWYRKPPLRFQFPALFLAGEKDIFLSTPTVEETTALHHNFQIKTIPGGHWLTQSHPNLVKKSIAEFLLELNNKRAAS